jgi:hypothetical protein
MNPAICEILPVHSTFAAIEFPCFPTPIYASVIPARPSGGSVESA